MLKNNVAYFKETLSSPWEGRTFDELKLFKSDFIKPDFIVDKAKKILEMAKIKVRDDQVKVCQLMVSVSGEFLRDEETGEINKIKTKKWADQSVRFLRSKYGDRLLACVLHMDETNPHMSAYLLPLVEKEVKYHNPKAKNKVVKSIIKPRLSCYSMFTADPFEMVEVDGKKKKKIIGEGTVSQLQTNYADFLIKNGLDVQRGIRRKPFQTGLQYQTVKEYYSKIAQPIADFEELKPWEIKPAIIEAQQKTNQYIEIKKQKEFYQENAADSIKELKNIKNEVALEKKQREKLSREISVSEAIEKITGLKPQSSDKAGFINFYFPNGLNLEIDLEKNKFINKTPSVAGLGNMSSKVQGRGAIDAIIYLTGWKTEETIEFLADTFSIEQAASVLIQNIKNSEPTLGRVNKVSQLMKFQNELIKNEPSKLNNLFEKLEGELKISRTLLNEMSEGRQLYTNKFGNLVFRKSVEEDGELLGTGHIVYDIHSKKIIHESEEDGLVPLAHYDNKAIILTVDPLEALALKSENQNNAVLLVSKNQESQTAINLYHAKRYKIFIAESLTEKGKQLAEWVKEKFPFVQTLHIPRNFKSWLDYYLRPQSTRTTEKIISLVRHPDDIPEPSLRRRKPPDTPGPPGNMG